MAVFSQRDTNMRIRKSFATLAGIWAALLVLMAPASAQIAKPVGETKLVIDFDDASIWVSENASPFAVAGEHVTQGKSSIKVQYTNKPVWSNIYSLKVPLRDWSGYRYLNFDLYLEGKMPGNFGMWVRDEALHKAEESWPIGPGWNTLTLDLEKMLKVAELNRAKVKSLCLYKQLKEEVTCHLDNMYLSKQKPVTPKTAPVRMPDGELLTNGGFEALKKPDKLGSPIDWWKSRRWQGASFLSRGKRAVFKGASSAMFDGRGVCKIGFFSPPVEVKCPTKLKLTAYVQADSLQAGLWKQTAAITVTDIGERSLPGASAKVPGGTYAWKKLEMVFLVPAKCPFVKVFMQSYGGGRLWVDEISLRGVGLDAETGITFTDTGRELVTDEPVVTESPDLLAKKLRARESMNQLRALVEEAQARNLETLYDEVPLVLGKLALDVRWDLPEHLELREGYADHVYQRCEEAKTHLRAVMAGTEPDLKVPPHPDFAKLEPKGRYFCEDGEPRILFSMQYHSKGELTRWFCPRGYEGSISAVGASRYDYQRTPVWDAYQKYPDTHRVYDDGWCGHIIKDKYSAGGTGRCVISLDSPNMLAAIAKSIETIHAPRVRKMSPAPLFVNMGFEYSYVNYDKYSADKFRKWLGRKYGTIAEMNTVWKTTHTGFADVTVPSYDFREAESNPAKYYDWGDFNLWRFTDFMKWAKAEIRKRVPGALTTTGGGEPFGANFWKQGIDEEALVREGVCDIWLSETGSRALGTTSVMDLQRHLSPEPRPIIDPEYHAKPNTCFQMFLHGCSMMDYWWWPNRVSDFYASSMKHSHLLTLPEVEVVMRTALDVRRLPKYITPFPAAKASVALLYPRASLIQRYPASKGHKTPFTLEVERTYAAAVRLDTPVGFASSRRIQEGVLKEFKLLLVPGCRYLNAEVFKRITDWVREGGTLLITPTSMIADEYSRRRNYLGDLGIKIVAEELPKLMAGDAKRGIDQSGELDFIQGPVAKTIVKEQPKRQMKAVSPSPDPLWPAVLDAEGVIQTVAASADWKAMSVYSDSGDPALLARELGNGTIFYMAGQMAVPSRKVLLDWLMNKLGFDRPVRALTPDGGYPDGVESRTVPHADGYLTYLHNQMGEERAVRLEVKGSKIAAIRHLNQEKELPVGPMTLAPYETRIMRVTVK